MGEKIPWDFPSSPMVKTQLPTQEVQVLSLVGRPHMQCDTAKKKKKSNMKKIPPKRASLMVQW